MTGRKRAGRSGRRDEGLWRRLPFRRRTLRQWAVLGIMVAMVAFSMVSAVKRGAHARFLSQELEALERAERVTQERLALERMRADSLASRARIRERATALGLRPATDRDITFIEDVQEGL